MIGWITGYQVRQVGLVLLRADACPDLHACAYSNPNPAAWRDAAYPHAHGYPRPGLC